MITTTSSLSGIEWVLVLSIVLGCAGAYGLDKRCRRPLVVASTSSILKSVRVVLPLLFLLPNEASLDIFKRDDLLFSLSGNSEETTLRSSSLKSCEREAFDGCGCGGVGSGGARILRSCDDASRFKSVEIHFIRHLGATWLSARWDVNAQSAASSKAFLRVRDSDFVEVLSLPLF